MTEPRPDPSPLPRTTAQVQPYVEVLGIDLTIEFLLAFGGAEIYITGHPRSRSRVTELVGAENARELERVSYKLQRRVPLAREWIGLVLHSQGLSIADIARKLHVTEVSVRAWLKKARSGGRTRRDGPQQLSLF